MKTTFPYVVIAVTMPLSLWTRCYAQSEAPPPPAVSGVYDGGDVNAVDGNGFTPLMTAALNRDAARVAALISDGADVNAADNDGDTALIDAAWKGGATCVRALLAARADVQKKNRFGITALELAAANGHTDCAQALVTAGADVGAKNDRGDTALTLAAKDGDIECVKILLAAGSDVNAKNNDGDTALIEAADDPFASLANADAKFRADSRSDNSFANLSFNRSAAHIPDGNESCVNALIAAGADVNAKNNRGLTALKLAKNNYIVAALKAAHAKR